MRPNLTRLAADLFKAADKMRGWLEPSEYKLVALGTWPDLPEIHLRGLSSDA